jgi:hypothetical protein
MKHSVMMCPLWDEQGGQGGMMAVTDARPGVSMRDQVIVSIALILVVAFWAVLIPAVNDRVEAPNAAVAGQSLDLGGAAMVPPEGWSATQQPLGTSLSTTLVKGGVTIVILGALPAGAPLDATVEASRTAASQQPAAVVSEPILATTDAGVPWGRVMVTAADGATVNDWVSDGTTQVTFISSGDPTAVKTLQSEIDAMIKSVVLAPASSTSSQVAA